MARTVRTNLVRRERRDPVAATRNPTYRGLDQPQVTEWNADQAFRYGVMANVVAFRCLQVWADAAAKYPFRAGATPPERPGATADHNPNARLAQLLGPPTRRVGNRVSGPNPEMTGRQLMAWTAAQRIATGRNAWEIEWTDAPGRGQVSALWPLPACHLEPIPTAGKAPRYYRGFRYTADPANYVDLTPEQVHYGWTMGGTDVRQPMAPLQASRYAITLAVMGDRQNLAFLKNGAVPAHIITTTEFASDDERKAFRDGWNAQYRGPDNAGKPRFHEVDDQGDGPVGEAIDIKTLGVSNRDSQFVQAHLQSLKEIAWGLGVPWSKIDAADRTFSNAEAEERVWLLERVVPFLETLADEINLRLAPMLGSEVGWFDLSGEEALRPKPRFTAADGVTLWSAGLATSEEVRGELGLDPEVELPAPPMMPALPAGGTPDGQARDVQGLTQGGAPGADPLPGGMAPPAALPSGARDASDLPADGGAGVDGGAGGTQGGHRARDGDTRALSAEEQEVRRTTIWRRNDAALRGLEARFAKAWADYFTRQAKAVVGQLTGKRTAVRLAAASQARELRADLGIGGPLDPNEIARWRAAAQDLADLMHTAATTAGVTRVNNAFGVSFDLEAPFVQDFIRARANQLAGQVTSSTYTAIQSALADGVANGASIDDLASAVQNVFDVASSSRAKTIARTEVISASNGSASLAASQLPSDVAAAQEWIATRDERTREDHDEADGQIVRIGEPFDVGGEMLAYPGDPAGSGENVISCRCTVAFLTPADFEASGGRARPTVVSLAAATLALRTLRAGDQFDPVEFRRSLLAVA
jgi:HK97 family phage portal protein